MNPKTRKTYSYSPPLGIALILALITSTGAVAQHPPIGSTWNFENGLGAWQTAGLWHLNASADCGAHDPRTGSSTVYFGIERACNYSGRLRQQGNLTSPVFVVGSGTTLTFDSLRQVEATAGVWDRTEVALSEVGSGTWHVLWARDSSHPSDAAWQQVGPISLAAFAGKSVQLRFRFDSKDAQQNLQLGWKVDNVDVGPSRSTGLNTAPVVTITTPADGTVITTSCVDFQATAIDSQEGDLAAQIAWSSDVDGHLGHGRKIRATLSSGSHQLTATVTDRGGLVSSSAVAVTSAIPPPAEPVTWCGDDR